MPRFSLFVACLSLCAVAGCAACPERPPDEGDGGSPRDAAVVSDPPDDAGAARDGGGVDASLPGECGGEVDCRRNFDCGGGFLCIKAEPEDEVGCCTRVGCTVDADCAATEQCSSFGQCQPGAACDLLAEESGCSDGEQCIAEGGVPACVAASEVPGAASCEVHPARLVLASGERLAAAAVGRTDDGGLAPRSPAPWTTWTTTLGTIEEGRFVRASCEGGEVCAGTLSAALPSGATCSADLVVLPPLADDEVRLTLLEPSSGAAVAGAPVALRLEGESEWYGDVTDDDGVVTFTGLDSAAGIAAVSAFPVGREWVTLVAPASSDLVATSAQHRSSAEAAGLKGTFTFPSYPGAAPGEIKVGLAGLSRAGGWLEELLPSPWPAAVTTQASLEGVTGPDGEPVDLPLGTEVWIGDEAIKPEWVALTDPGARVLWGFAGRLRLSEVGELVSMMTDDEPDEIALALRLAQMSGGAAHGLAGPFDLPAQPLPALDGAESPAWPFDEAHLSTQIRPLLEPQADVGELPCLPGAGVAGDCAAYAAGVTVRLGAVVPALGFVPLALSAAADDPDPNDALDELDGFVDDAEGALPKGRVLLGAAPPHGGLEGWPVRYLVTASARGDEGELLGRSAVVAAPAGDDEASSLPSFLSFPTGTFTTATSFSAPASGASLGRLRLSSSEGVWSVWTADDEVSLELSALRPLDVTGRDEDADWQLVRLAAAADGQDLFSLAGVRLDHLDALLESAANASCVEPSGNTAAACERLP